MTPTQHRDRVAELAKSDPAQAAKLAKGIVDPWFRAQAWAHLARWADDPLRFARNAAKSAAETNDDYQRCAVRAWEIAALAERNFCEQARHSLFEAVELATSVAPIGSRAEALLLLCQAAFKISRPDAVAVADAFDRSCDSTHWRAVRTGKYIGSMLSGEMPARSFFW